MMPAKEGMINLKTEKGFFNNNSAPHTLLSDENNELTTVENVTLSRESKHEFLDYVTDLIV